MCYWNNGRLSSNTEWFRSLTMAKLHQVQVTGCERELPTAPKELKPQAVFGLIQGHSRHAPFPLAMPHFPATLLLQRGSLSGILKTSIKVGSSEAYKDWESPRDQAVILISILSSISSVITKKKDQTPQRGLCENGARPNDGYLHKAMPVAMVLAQSLRGHKLLSAYLASVLPSVTKPLATFLCV